MQSKDKLLNSRQFVRRQVLMWGRINWLAISVE